MRTKRLFGLGLVVTLLGVALWGCGSQNDVTAPAHSYTPPPAGSGAGLLAVEIESFGSLNDGLEGVFTAAESDSGHGQGHKERTPLTALFVTFDAIRIYPACEDSAGQDTCDYLEFPIEPPVTVDVAGLDSTLTEVLGTLELAMGDYTHLALQLADSWVITAEGDSVSAELPGGDQNWLKVIVPFTVEDGGVTAIVIAFDLSRSIVETPPGSGNFKIKPVLHGHVGQGSSHHGEGGEGSGGEGGQGQGGGSGQGSGGEGGEGSGGGN